MNMTDVQDLLKLADQKRNAQQWSEAVRLYRQLEPRLAGHAAFHHNLALCLLGDNQPGDALAQADLALARDAGMWQSAVVKVRALCALGQSQEAALLLDALRERHPERAEFSLELATIALHQECDARRARQLVNPFLSHSAAATDAALTDLMASLYDRDEAGQVINDRARQFARAHLDRGVASRLFGTAPLAARARRARKRLGLLSPHFNCSPVFFFCSGALSLLASEFDLYFFNRSHRVDWATRQLRSLATQWFDVADMSAEPLDAFVRQHALDVLVDLGGWMDPIALKAISTKPAARMYKWVGGQSITTGLRAFDGFITDDEQTPAGYEAWFTEPLVRLPQGYVSYAPPPYMPAPVPASAHSHVLGIIANPVKVSQPFLGALPATLRKRAGHGLPLELRFIDKRYQHPQLKARILDALQGVQAELRDQLRVEFIVPGSHQAYLSAVGQLTEMVDTFPYTGGLTTMEALSLGVHCSGTAGTLFCERHTHAHWHYLQAAGAPTRRKPKIKPGAARTSLVPPDCPRADHAALAESLVQLFTHGSVQRLAA
jgi:protein O-GlcNAc transferase